MMSFTEDQMQQKAKHITAWTSGVPDTTKVELGKIFLETII